MLWPELNSRRSQANLRHAIWEINQTLGLNWLGVEGQRLWLQAGYGLDVAVFLTAVSTAKKQANLSQDTLDLATLGGAVELVQDEFMAGFYLKNAAPFDDWQFFQGERIHQNLVEALHLLVTGYSVLGAWEPAIRYGKRWLQADPLHEPAHVWMIHLYANSGQKAAALRQYSQCHQILREQLEIEPQWETVALFEKIRMTPAKTMQSTVAVQQTPHTPTLLPADMPDNQVHEPGPLPTGSHMPLTPNPLFIGRQTELQTIAQELKQNAAIAVGKIVAVTGLGGIGRTQLAVEFAYRYGRYFPGGVFWLHFTAAESIPAQIAACGGLDGMNLRSDFDTLPLKKQVELVQHNWRKSIPQLLIFDGCQEESLLIKWRPPHGGSHIIVTSRRGQWDLALGVHQLPLTLLSREESIALLCRFRPDMKITEADAIAGALGDLPLALHLAGSYLRSFQASITPATYLAQLNASQHGAKIKHPSLQGQSANYSPTQHDLNIAQTFALSYQHLTVADETNVLAQSLLKCAAYFAPAEPIPLHLLFATVGEQPPAAVHEALIRLIGLGLVQEQASDTVSLHQLVVDFVTQMAVNGSAQTAVENVLAKEAERINDLAKPAMLVPWQVHLRYVTEAALKNGSSETGRLCFALGQHLHMAGEYEGAHSYLEKARLFWEQQLEPAELQVAKCMNELGLLFQAIGMFAEAETHYKWALKLRRKILDPFHLSIAQSLNNLGFMYISSGNYRLACQYLEETLIFVEHSVGLEAPHTAFVLSNLGVALQEMGELARAKQYAERSLAIREQAHGLEHPITAYSLCNLGWVLYHRGDLTKAQSLLEQALAIRERELGPSHPSTADTLARIGRLFQKVGDFGKARTYLMRALTIQESVLGADHLKTATTLCRLGGLLLVEGNQNEAKRYLDRAVAIREQYLGEDHPKTVDVYRYLESYYLTVGEKEKAKRPFEK